MKVKKMLLVLVSLVLVAAMLAGCGAAAQKAAEPAKAAESAKPAEPAKEEPKKEEAKPAEPAKEIYIPVISKGFQHQFWQAVKMGSEQAAKEFNVKITFEGPETEAQIDKQVEMLQAALAKKPAAICLAALDTKACIPLLQQCKEKNIPIIGFDSGVDSDIPVTTCSTNNIAAAALAADKMAELIGGKGEVAVICHDQTSRTGVDRRDGFVNQIKNKYKDIKIVDLQYANDQPKAVDLAKAMIQAHPNLKGIFGSNEPSATGAIKGVIEMKKDGKLVVIGYDAGKAQKDAVRSGQMAGAITQDPVGIGYKAVEAAVKAIKGEKLPKDIDTGFKWYDKTNMDQDVFKPLLYD